MSEAALSNGLKRKLGLFPVTNIVVANMIGTGIFTTSGLLMANLNHPLLMIILWFFAGLFAMCGALCYGELGAAMPKAGGEYLFLSRLYNPLLGFLSGWVSLIVGFSAPIAAATIGFSEYFTTAVPSLINLGENIGFSNPIIIKRILSVLIIIIFTLVHIRGLKLGMLVQNSLTVLKILLILGLLLLGFWFGTGSFDNIFDSGSFKFDFGGWKSIALSLMWILFAYTGWNSATYIGSEIRNPQKNLPRSLIIGTGAVTLLYLLLNTLYCYAVPMEEMKGEISICGVTVGYLFGDSWEKIFSLLISFALFSSISALTILGPRVYFAMAKDGNFFKFVSRVNSKTQVPSYSIILQSCIAIILVLSGTFEQILTYMGFSLGLFPILAVFGIFKLRKNKLSVYKSPIFPFIPLFFILISLSMLILAYFERPLESSIALLTVAAGIPAYMVFQKKKAD